MRKNILTEYGNKTDLKPVTRHVWISIVHEARDTGISDVCLKVQSSSVKSPVITALLIMVTCHWVGETGLII